MARVIGARDAGGPRGGGVHGAEERRGRRGRAVAAPAVPALVPDAAARAAAWSVISRSIGSSSSISSSISRRRETDRTGVVGEWVDVEDLRRRAGLLVHDEYVVSGEKLHSEDVGEDEVSSAPGC